MSAFDSLFRAAVGVVLLPVDAVSDIVTLGGALTEGESQVAKRVRHIGNNLDKATRPEG